ncbi:GAF and ANTAR domain-containing protein [Streptomyces chrestomyceticus]|uniref:GAF and ANTAR domain-containing protein n=1 Tax=Streptomyces chrestomyceticus TaxID=68185 RepID=UPI00340C1272
MGREAQITQTFVELADTFVKDFDVVDFLHQLTVRCREILAVTDAAVLLAHPGERLHSPAPCDPSPAFQDLLATALAQGPALDAYRTSTAQRPTRQAPARARWPAFTAQARAAGYHYTCALPMRLRDETLGSLLLLRTDARPLPAADLALAQAFADAATLGLLHAHTHERQETVNQQLHTALHSRIVIEQAKGILAARHHTSLNHAFNAIRHHARNHGQLLTTVAHDVINHGLLTPGTTGRTEATPE